MSRKETLIEEARDLGLSTSGSISDLEKRIGAHYAETAVEEAVEEIVEEPEPVEEPAKDPEPVEFVIALITEVDPVERRRLVREHGHVLVRTNQPASNMMYNGKYYSFSAGRAYIVPTSVYDDLRSKGLA